MSPPSSQAATLSTRFDIKHECGQGRFATVYRAFDTELQREVALKVCKLAGRTDDEKKQLGREARVTCRLRHPAIASGLDGYSNKKTVVLSLPFLDGGTLTNWRDRALKAQVEILATICDAVDYAHRTGIVHADIKPENILFDSDDNPFLADFGSCVPVKPKDRSQSSTQAIGTAAYLAPEIASGQSRPWPASDIYALGCLLFYLVEGRPPFDGETHAILHQISTADFPPLLNTSSQDERSIQAIIDKACHRDPKNRYKTANELREDLLAFLAHEPVAARPIGRLGKGRLWAVRNPLSAAFSGLLFAVLVVGTLASSAGWNRSVRRQSQLNHSQSELVKRGEQAKQKEAELQSLLVSIRREQNALEAATQNERRLRERAENLRTEISLRSKEAETQLAEANRIEAITKTLSEEQGTLIQSLAQAKQDAQTQAKWKAESDRRDAAWTQVELAMNHIRKQDFSQARAALTPVPEDLRGYPWGVADMLIRMRRSRGRNRTSSLPNHLRQSTTSPLATGFTETDAIVIGFRDGARWSTDKHLQRSFTPRRRGSGGTVPIPSTGMIVGNAKSPDLAWVSRSSAVVSNRVKKTYSICECKFADPGVSDELVDERRQDLGSETGQAIGIAYRDDNELVVVRHRTDTDQLVLETAVSKETLWTSESVAEFGSAPTINRPAVRIDCGTDPSRHVCVAIRRLFADREEVVLVSLHLRQPERTKVWRCGPGDPAGWPRQWSLGDDCTLGLLANTDDHGVSQPGPWLTTKMRTLGDSITQIQYFDGKWRPIAEAASPSVVTDTTRIRNPLSIQSPIDPDKREPQAIVLGKIPGRVVIWKKTPVVFDLVAGRAMTAGVVAGVSSTTQIVPAPSRSVMFAFDRKKLVRTSLSSEKKASYLNADRADHWLGAIAAAMADISRPPGEISAADTPQNDAGQSDVAAQTKNESATKPDSQATNPPHHETFGLLPLDQYNTALASDDWAVLGPPAAAIIAGNDSPSDEGTHAAMLTLLAGNKVAFEDYRSRVFEAQVGASKNWKRVKQIEVLLTEPGTKRHLDLAAKRLREIEQDLSDDNKRVRQLHCPLLQCLLKYRQGEYAEAVKRSQSQIAIHQIPYYLCIPQAILSLAHFKLGDLDQAKQSLAELQRLIPPPQARTYRSDRVQLLLACVLQKEAEALLASEPFQSATREESLEAKTRQTDLHAETNGIMPLDDYNRAIIAGDWATLGIAAQRATEAANRQRNTAPHAAAILLIAGNQSAFQAHRNQAATLEMRPQDTWPRISCVSVLLLGDPSPEDLAVATRHLAEVEKILTLAPDDLSGRQAKGLQCLLKYRLGNLSEALETSATLAAEEDDYFGVLPLAVAAMTQHRLENSAAANDALARLKKKIPRLDRFGDRHGRGQFAFAFALQREAERLIGGNQAGTLP